MGMSTWFMNHNIITPVIKNDRNHSQQKANPDMFTPTSGHLTEICPKWNSDYRLQGQKDLI